MDTATQVQIQDKDISISHNVNILKKGMNPTILLPENSKADWAL